MLILVVSDVNDIKVKLTQFVRRLNCSVEDHCSKFDAEFWEWLTRRIEQCQPHQEPIAAIVGWFYGDSSAVRNAQSAIRDLAECLKPPVPVIFLSLDQSIAELSIVSKNEA